MNSNGEDFTVPDGVNVVQVNIADTSVPMSYVGVTPGTRHHLLGFNNSLVCFSHGGRAAEPVEWMSIETTPDAAPTYYLSWSSEINEKTPTVYDY